MNDQPSDEELMRQLRKQFKEEEKKADVKKMTADAKKILKQVKREQRNGKK